MDQEDLRYSYEHLWARLDEDRRVTIGLSEAALSDKVDIQEVLLPDEGEEVIKDEPFGHLSIFRSKKLDLYAPLSGEVTEVNEEAVEAPDVIFEDPYQEGWLIRVEVSSLLEYNDLMTPEEYQDYLEEEELEEVEDREEEEDDY